MQIPAPAYADEQLKTAIQAFNDAAAASYAQEAEAEKDRAAAAQIIASKEGDPTAAMQAIREADRKKEGVILARPRLSDALPDIVKKWNACRAVEIARLVSVADERRKHLVDLCQREGLRPAHIVLNCCPALAAHCNAAATMEAPRFDLWQKWADEVSAAAFEASGVPVPAPEIVRRGRPGGLATA